MTATYLDAIIAAHRLRASQDQREWRDRHVPTVTRASLRSAIENHRPSGVAVIAEVKRRSPSKGWLAPDLDAAATARLYANAGASGISVLTDEPHFGGSLDDLSAAAAAVGTPLLRKDFTVAPNDVLDAAEHQASAILLIVAALTDDELSSLHTIATDLGLDVLVEVHDEVEARRAVDLGATMIGVNQRDLHTFDVDAERAERVASSLPRDVVAVAESGFSSVAAVSRAASSGFDAVLVGETFVRSAAPGDEVRSYIGHPIGRRQQ